MARREPTHEPIRDLIETLRGERSWRQLVEDCGGNPTRVFLTKAISEPPTQIPTLTQIEGLCRGLRVTPSVIVQTWGIALGLWDEGTWGAPQFYLLDGWTDLTLRQQASVARLVGELRDANQADPVSPDTGA